MMADGRLLSDERLAWLREFFSQRRWNGPEANVLLDHIDALTEQLQELARATVAYDEAIMACANDPALMATYCTAQGDDLDALYFEVMTRARTVLGLPNVRGELAPQPVVD